MSVPTISQSTRYRPSSRLVAYVLAFVLPVASWVITTRVQALHALPMALAFLSMALIATLGGLGPASISVFLSAVGRAYDFSSAPHPSSSVSEEIVRICVLIAGALIISLMSRRRRASEARLEIALGELQERTDALIQSLDSGKCASWIFNLDDGQETRWYAGSYPVFGRPFGEIETMPALLALLHPEDRPHVASLLDKMKASDVPVRSEHRIFLPNGDLHWLEMRATRIAGAGCRWRGVTLDITERKLAEAALLRSEKLAAMGRLASTVAHEINNPLEAVTNLLYLAGNDESLDAETRTYINMADRELARLGNITRLTLGFVRTNSSTVDVEIAESVEDVLAILRHRFEARAVRIDRRYEPNVRISIPPHELRQIATNLIANASDAVAGSGPNATVAIEIMRHENSAVLLIEDNGTGIPADNLARIFDPFFSTKEEVGTGIGLWVTKEIVEKNGGQISVKSGDLPSGFRTSFRVEFPLATSAQPHTFELSSS